MMWTFPQAKVLIDFLQPESRKFGYHLALGGGVLNRGESEKDLDLYFLPMESLGPSDPVKLIAFLTELWGRPKNLGGDYPTPTTEGRGQEQPPRGIWSQVSETLSDSPSDPMPIPRDRLNPITENVVIGRASVPPSANNWVSDSFWRNPREPEVVTRTGQLGSAFANEVRSATDRMDAQLAEQIYSSSTLADSLRVERILPREVEIPLDFVPNPDPTPAAPPQLLSAQTVSHLSDRRRQLESLLETTQGSSTVNRARIRDQLDLINDELILRSHVEPATPVALFNNMSHLTYGQLRARRMEIQAWQISMEGRTDIATRDRLMVLRRELNLINEELGIRQSENRPENQSSKPSPYKYKLKFTRSSDRIDVFIM